MNCKLIYLNPKKGLTLIETVVTVSIVTIFIGLVFSFFISTNKAYKARVAEGLAENIGSQTIYKISKDLREARPPEGTSLTAIAEAEENSIIFYADVAGGEDGREERVRYFLDGTALKEGLSFWSEAEGRYITENEKIRTINNYVTNNSSPIFTYFGEDYTGSEAPLEQPVTEAQIRIVEIKILTDLEPNRDPQPFEAKTKVQLRNM